MSSQPTNLSQKGLSRASTGGIKCQQSILQYITSSQPVTSSRDLHLNYNKNPEKSNNKNSLEKANNHKTPEKLKITTSPEDTNNVHVAPSANKPLQDHRLTKVKSKVIQAPTPSNSSQQLITKFVSSTDRLTPSSSPITNPTRGHTL
jgi:hypothetical protein